jgi:hypothetical protein
MRPPLHNSKQTHLVQLGIRLHELQLFPMPAKKSYKSSDKVPVGGIYKVSHAEHRVPHEVTLLAGQIFPPCARCGNQVTFQVIRRVKALKQRRERIVLHALPVFEDSSEEKLPT